MSTLWFVPDSGSVVHYVATTEPAGYHTYNRGSSVRATVKCLCGAVRPGNTGVLVRRGTAAIRCREIADRRGIARPLPLLNWKTVAKELAGAILNRTTDDGRAAEVWTEANDEWG